MTYVALVTLVILMQYIFFTVQAGIARGKADIKAPAMHGDENYERCNRIQSNTLEMLIVTLPAMWLCAHYFRADVASIFGIIFVIGRFLFAAAYLNEPTKRGPGMMLSMLPNVAMIGCAMFGAVSQLL